MEGVKVYPDVTDAFVFLGSTPDAVSDSCMKSIERFTVLMYDRTSTKLTVNEARKQLFAQKGRSLDAIPPSRSALLEHTKHTGYQAVHCWGLKSLKQVRCCQAQTTGAGLCAKGGGIHSGRHFQMWRSPVACLSAVDVRKGAGEDALARK